MITKIDAILDRVTMYRLVLYVLLATLGVAVAMAYIKVLPFSPLALLASTGFLVLMCWAANTIFAHFYDVPVNIESATITALILALIIDPAQTPGAFQFLGWAAILAMASKYILAINRKHVFNPAAIAVVITSFALGQSASWWVGTPTMLPTVLLGGLLILRKLRQSEALLLFGGTVLAVGCGLALAQGRAIPTVLSQLLLESPLFFFLFIMLTEPLTAPPTRNLRRLYTLLVGVLFVPQVHIAQFYFTPELALVSGNIFSYLVSPKAKVILRLAKRVKMTPDIMDFVFKSSQRLAFAPGQYMEFTLAHPHADSRGNRRYFTLASSPTEDMLHLGVRFYDQGSSFKRAMQKMDGRTKIVAAQIAGDFTLPRDPRRKLVFIAGGIGITPYRSMLKYLLDTQQRRDIALLYVNRDVDEIVYRDVLSQAQSQLGVKVYCTLTDVSSAPRNWPGLLGRIDEQMILRAVPDYAERTFYLSGPPEMVRSCEQVLRNLRIPEHQIKKDFFPGLV